jgi:hypothetical protein
MKEECFVASDVTISQPDVLELIEDVAARH